METTTHTNGKGQTITVAENLHNGCGRVEFSIDGLDRFYKVEVFVLGQYGRTPTAQVNWAGIGSVDPEVAVLYAALINAAADWAAGWNADAREEAGS